MAFIPALAALALAMSTPALLDAEALAGDWTLSGPDGGACRLVLKTTPAHGAPGLYADPQGCPGPAGQAKAWRVSSDGFALADARGHTLLFFAKVAGGRFEAQAQGVTWVLSRPR